MDDLISIIIPVYDVEQYLPRCVDSALSQTYRNVEIILVDDGSPDHCSEICDAYAKKDSRIRVIHKENGGLSDARNAALDICSGEYISFLDSDDFISEEHIETLYHAIKEYHTKLAICGMMRIDETGKTSVQFSPSDQERCVSGVEMAKTVWQPSACNKMYHRSLFDGIRYPFGKLYEDLFIYHDILARVDCVAFTGRNSYYYFNRRNSIMNKEYDIRNTDLIEGLDLRICRLREMQFDELADQQLSFVFNHTVEAFEELRDTNFAERERLKEIRKICNRHFGAMMSFHGFSAAQKGKIALFRFCPVLYLHIFASGL